MNNTINNITTILKFENILNEDDSDDDKADDEDDNNELVVVSGVTPLYISISRLIRLVIFIM
jgi:hypothetical protein